MAEAAPVRSRFFMPLIAPAPDGYAGDATAYYAEVLQQCAVSVVPVAVEPEEILSQGGSAGTKGLLVTLGDPDGVFQSGQGGQGPAQPPWRTMFAMAGGFLTYVRSTHSAGLNAWMPPPYDAITPPFAPAAPAGLSTPLWGTFVLRLWAPDVSRMQTKLESDPACGTLFYVGVAEDSIAATIAPLIERAFPQSRFDATRAKAKKPSLQRLIEKIAGAPYTSPPSYNQSVNDLIARFLDGETSLLVEGGALIGKTVLVSSGGASDAGQLILWACDSSAAPAFAPAMPYFDAAVAAA
jgi:hypothetical protein